MNTHVCIPIPMDEFLTLVDFLRKHDSNRDPVIAVRDAIEFWIERANISPDLLLPETVLAESRGYMWRYKDTYLFLPHGTEIRMRYKQQYHYAKVDGDQILHEGKAVSPSLLANTITGSSRNAWRDLWLKRPDEKEWKLADQCRQSQEADGELEELRLSVSDARTTPQKGAAS
jgi:hypothetical protein